MEMTIAEGFCLSEWLDKWRNVFLIFKILKTRKKMHENKERRLKQKNSKFKRRKQNFCMNTKAKLKWRFNIQVFRHVAVHISETCEHVHFEIELLHGKRRRVDLKLADKIDPMSRHKPFLTIAEHQEAHMSHAFNTLIAEGLSADSPLKASPILYTSVYFLALPSGHQTSNI